MKRTELVEKLRKEAGEQTRKGVSLVVIGAGVLARTPPQHRSC